jgi:hypothetical protein
MINKKAFSDLGTGMDFNPCKKTADMRNKPGEKGNMPVPQSMSQTMELAGMKAGIDKNDLKDVLHCRVTVKGCLNIISDIFNKLYQILTPEELPITLI